MSRPAPLASRCFDFIVLAVGLVLAANAAWTLATDGAHLGWSLVSIPLIVLIARFPMILEREDGGVEVGFDSCVLMFLVCTLKPYEALVLWSLGVVLTQLTTDKRLMAKLFNVGVGIVGGAIATSIITGIRSGEIVTPRGLLAVSLGAAGYFVTDYLLSAIAVALEVRTSILRTLVQPGTAIAVACFVPFDSLGYLGAVLVHRTAWWVLCLLAVPLVTLLVATRAVTRGRENARRLQVLFGAAVRAQTLSDPRQVVDALIDDAQQLLRLNEVEVRATPPAPHEIGARVRDGQRERWVVTPSTQRARSTVTADQTALEAMAAVSSDAFARLRLSEDMTHLARHDVLTGLPNRGLLLDRLEHALQMSRRRSSKVALLFCDLDGFKPVNDRFGHAAGDALLVDVAQRLTGCVRESDTVARLGGDEFAILLEDIKAAEVDAACERVLAALRSGAVVSGHKVQLGVSIGVAMGDTGSSAEHLLRNADMAMYEAKSRGKGTYAQYERSLGQTKVQRLELLESLRASVAAGDLSLVYQPVVRVDTGHITGVEALARWRANGVSVRPDVFIRAAEESGLIVALGDVVLDLALRDAEKLRYASGGQISLSVNISPKQLVEPSFVAKVERAVKRLRGVELVLELTERDYISEDGASLEAMSRLAAAGVAFAIDDFGVGFSAIGYLKDLPVKIIKTDNTFSEAIDRDERSCALLSSIAMMGQALELDVVVEGIERAAQLEHLRDHTEAAYAQGFLLHRPMPVEEVAEVIRKNRQGPILVAEPPVA
jgi:diguanylate cyclase (GGDEF)-like protein